jgi:hypothetical protein
MPNIEIYGLAVNSMRDVATRMVAELRDKIFDLFKDSPFVGEMVVTAIDSDVTDKNREDQPFLRLFSSEEDHVPEILEKLQTLGMDIEYQKLEKFIPKKT